MDVIKSSKVGVFRALRIVQWVKIVPIRSVSGSYFPVFGLITERYGVYLRIDSECGEIRTRKTPNTNTFHALVATLSKAIN